MIGIVRHDHRDVGVKEVALVQCTGKVSHLPTCHPSFAPGLLTTNEGVTSARCIEEIVTPPQHIRPATEPILALRRALPESPFVGLRYFPKGSTITRCVGRRQTLVAGGVALQKDTNGCPLNRYSVIGVLVLPSLQIH